MAMVGGGASWVKERRKRRKKEEKGRMSEEKEGRRWRRKLNISHKLSPTNEDNGLNVQQQRAIKL